MYVERFMSFLRFEKHYSEHTLKAYEKDVRSYLQFWVAEQISFEEVGHKQLRYYLSILMDSGLEASSINRILSSLRTYYKFLQRESLYGANPTLLVKAL